jgi:hypothetical protein
VTAARHTAAVHPETWYLRAARPDGRSGIGFEEVGMRTFKGVPEPWRIFRVASV